MNLEEKWLLEEKYGGVESDAFLADCRRLQAGEPLGYVIGHVPFLGCRIYLDDQPLIPRPETEWWVEQAIKVIQKSAAAKPPHLLDLCAGSGAIGIAVAHAIPSAHVTFGEVDEKLKTTILKNLEANSIESNRFKVVNSDLFENVIDTFDYILTNPPYIDPTLDRTEASVKDFEPHLALYGGETGMEHIAKIVATAPAYLNEKGELWIEHEPEQSVALQTLAAQNSFSVTTHTDQYNVERYSRLVLQ